MHFWIRAETRPDEARVPLTPIAVQALLADGHQVTVEHSAQAAIPAADYGVATAKTGDWRDAPQDAVILGLKELPEDGTPLRHRHIMFGHAYKQQAGAEALLDRFRTGGGALLDLEYLTTAEGRRRVAFGYWAGFAGALVTARAWAAAVDGRPCPAVSAHSHSDAMVAEARADLNGRNPSVLVIGAKGRVGSGAVRAAQAMGLTVTEWDLAETAHGGPYPEVRSHDILLNCILAGPKTPVFLPAMDLDLPRQLAAIGDIACDPGSPFSPLPFYDRATTWTDPALTIRQSPPLVMMAIDNLPSLLPTEASQDFSDQLLPILQEMPGDPAGTWARAKTLYEAAIQS